MERYLNSLPDNDGDDEIPQFLQEQQLQQIAHNHQTNLNHNDGYHPLPQFGGHLSHRRYAIPRAMEEPSLVNWNYNRSILMRDDLTMYLPPPGSPPSSTPPPPPLPPSSQVSLSHSSEEPDLDGYNRQMQILRNTKLPNIPKESEQ